MTPSAVAFSEFRATYPLQPPRALAIKNDDELKQMSAEDGLQCFDTGATNENRLSMPKDAENRGDVYLWVVTAEGAHYAYERLPFGEALESRIIKHTNLTGGSHAHCGGEVWFPDNDSVLIGGDSGRYGPKDEEQLTRAAEAFSTMGYRVASLGFDDDTGRPNTILVGEPQWL